MSGVGASGPGRYAGESSGRQTRRPTGESPAASTSRFARWYASTRYDWFMLGVLVGIVWASLFWWVFR